MEQIRNYMKPECEVIELKRTTPLLAGSAGSGGGGGTGDDAPAFVDIDEESL